MHADQRLAESFQGLSDDAFLKKAYMSLLGRAPDVGGATAYLDRLRSGVPRTQIWSEIASADEARRFASRQAPASRPAPAPAPVPVPVPSWQPRPGSVNDLLMLDGVEFVRSAYREVLGREADATGLSDYTTRLSSGTSKQQLLADLRCDPEGRAFAAPLPGLDDLVLVVQKSGTPPDDDVTAETLDDLLALQGEVFVRAAYRVLFKRDPDPQGLKRYLELLRAGHSNMLVLKALYEAPEAREKSAQLAGLKTAIRNYDKAQRRSWKGWYYRAVLGAPSELPRDRELRALFYRLTEVKR